MRYGGNQPGSYSCLTLHQIPWQGSGNEKFIFDNPKVCMIYNAGELTLVEYPLFRFFFLFAPFSLQYPLITCMYGNNTALGSCRTEHVSAHLISVRLSERKGEAGDTNSLPSSKKIAYLIDLQTVKIDDLESGLTLATINHDDSKIDWLEVNCHM